MVSSSKLIRFALLSILSFSFFIGSITVSADEQLEQYYDSKLSSYGLTDVEISLMDTGMKEIIIVDFEKDLNNNIDSKLSYHQGEVKEYYFDKDRNLVEIPHQNQFMPFSTIPTSDLKLFFSTANNGQKIQRIFANFEWTKKETAPREFIGFSKESKFDIIPGTYEARIMSRSQTYYDWQYYGNAGGRPYAINANHGATWNWKGNSAYYKGHVSFRVDTFNARSGILQMQYASDPQASSTQVNVSFGPVSIGHTLSNNRTMLKAPHRGTLILRTGP